MTDRTTTIRVMTFNIRGSCHTVDGANAWAGRAALNVAVIKRHAPDLIGFQELQRGNLETYRACLAGYDHRLGPPAKDGEPHDFNAIFWQPTRLAPLDAGGFWLSRTPDRPSGDWGAACIRVANWVRLRAAAGDAEFLHLNTHLDHISEPARLAGCRLILRQFAELGADALPVVVTGDFNCLPGSPAYRLFRAAGFTDVFLAAGNEDGEGTDTFHKFLGEGYPAINYDDRPTRIDWILTRDGAHRWQARSCAIVRDAAPPLYPSDHYPVLAELALG
jgi:endonuclease/exonuclease/phosphatase family metal-dependent hydrolase